MEPRTSICEKRVPLLFICVFVRNSGRISTKFSFLFGRTQTCVWYEPTSLYMRTVPGSNPGLPKAWPSLAHVSYCEWIILFITFALFEFSISNMCLYQANSFNLEEEVWHLQNQLSGSSTFSHKISSYCILPFLYFPVLKQLHSAQ
jgi:hypothetical protein